MACVGIGLRKKSARIAAADGRGRIPMNRRIPHTRGAIGYGARRLPRRARHVIGPSPVRGDTCRHMTGGPGPDVMASNPYTALPTARSRKADRADAAVPADMLRGGFISRRHVPDRRAPDGRKAVRRRHRPVGRGAGRKNPIHGMPLQMPFKPGAAVPSTPVWLARVRRVGGCRTGGRPMQIRSPNESIIKADVRIAGMAGDNPDAVPLKTMPGAGYLSAPAISSMTGGTGRLDSPGGLRPYAGLAPPVGGSAGTVRHGSMTRRGDAPMRRVLAGRVPSRVRHAKNSCIAGFCTRIRKRGSGKALTAAASRMPRTMHGMPREGKGHAPYRSWGRVRGLYVEGDPRQIMATASPDIVILRTYGHWRAAPIKGSLSQGWGRGSKQAEYAIRIPADPPWAAGGGKTRSRQRGHGAAVRHAPGKGTQMPPPQLPASGRAAVSGPAFGPTRKRRAAPRRRRIAVADAGPPHAVGSGNPRRPVGCVGLSEPDAGLGGFGAQSGHAVPRRQATQGICGNLRMSGLRGRKRRFRRDRRPIFWSLATAWGGRGNVWGNGASIRGKSRGCVGLLAWRAPFEHGRPPRVWGRRTHENQGHGSGVSLRTLRASGNIWRRRLGIGDGPVHGAAPGSAVAAPLQAIGMLGVPVTALPGGGSHHACACGRVPPREAAETRPCRIHVWHCPGAPRASLDSLRAAGAAQVGAVVGAEVVAGPYADHRVSARGALLFLASSHPPCAGIRFILLILAGTVPAAAAIRLMRACAKGRHLPAWIADAHCRHNSEQRN